MCRFALIKSKNKIRPQEILCKFAAMAKKSRAYDGDWQGDGWGISWLDDKNWQVKKSLKPIWEDESIFDQFPATHIFIIHARSASFPEHKGLIEYNEPFVNNKVAFVFNGRIRRVRFSKNIPGKIGAQKIFFILNRLLKKNKPLVVLQKFAGLLKDNVRDPQACNIGLSDKQNIYALNIYNNHPEYYTLHYFNTPDLKIICSEKLEGYEFKPMQPEELISL